ncbi:aspartyl-tRNA synthetase [Neorickettsia risticii str. Illinois]|uniref:Aspartate--tRNA(Asp/Asn) ligase n=1 Tax=Neorickettsia risticii (strain Illinois) TaxID=434131 RepID=C6V4W7_NEORI|nr:aspartyl-tRNA synthetase [Neorickettsia risticii str. Illinois]
MIRAFHRGIGLLKSSYRDCGIGEISEEHVGEVIKLAGWVFRKRDHGAILFIDLRDAYGVIQLVASESIDGFEELRCVSCESVITVQGLVSARSPETINNSLQNGKIEVIVNSWSVNSHASSLPLQVDSEFPYPEETRLRYRYLDLRRDKLKKNIILRSKIISEIRKFMEGEGFTEFQTPILTATSPEGARDYIVPSRIHKGKFYALPQAPQQFKQLLMVAGFDRYFQIAPCFRDEDSRADRSPGEFYQLDVEMSFVGQEEVFELMERLLTHIFSKYSNRKVSGSFERIPYEESMLLYGTDKPDLRNPIKIADFTSIFGESGLAIFAEQIQKGAVVRGIPAPNCGNKPRKFFDEMIKYATTELCARGLAYLCFDSGIPKGPIAKFLSFEQISEIAKKACLSKDDAIFFSCDAEQAATKIAGAVRKRLGLELSLIDNTEYKFCWIVDFPYFELDETTGKLDFSHNPFSMPKGGLEALNGDPLKVVSQQYDIVCNGVELSSGAVRNHKPEIMYRAFDMLGLDKEYVNRVFGALIESFQYGVPPHAGIAPGIDRMVMLIAEEENIREVIAFPMNQRCEDSLMRAPSPVETERLLECGVKLVE